MPNAQLEAWEGKFGDSYTERNAEGLLQPRIDLWRDIWDEIDGFPEAILEVGANIGLNLLALRQMLPHNTPYMAAVEPNAIAREALILNKIPAYLGQAEQLDFAPDSFDLVFTSGVLVHLSPKPSNGLRESPLYRGCKEIVRVSKKWVVAIEYFSAEPREVIYRNRPGLLWTQDFGQFYIDKFELEPVACGFAWKALTGLDNLTWWVLRKK